MAGTSSRSTKMETSVSDFCAPLQRPSEGPLWADQGDVRFGLGNHRPLATHLRLRERPFVDTP